MVYMRGQREDYDGWAAQLGNNGEWSYADMLPHFKGIERNSQVQRRISTASPAICAFPTRATSRDTTEDFLLAARALGHPYNPDFNGARQNGVGIMQHTYGQLGPPQGALRRQEGLPRSAGRRRPPDHRHRRAGRPHPRSRTAAPSASPIREDGDHADRPRRAARCWSAPAPTTRAKLMMLSGLGPADHLREHGIDVVADLPGVGAEPAGPSRGPGDRHHQGQVRLFRRGQGLADAAQRPRNICCSTPAR